MPPTPLQVCILNFKRHPLTKNPGYAPVTSASVCKKETIVIIVILKSVRVTRNSKPNSGLLLKLVKSETVTLQTSYYVRVNSRGAHLPLATPMLEFGPGHEFGLGP